MKKALIIFASLLLGISVHAQKKYTVSGELYNKNDRGELLIGAHVIYGPGHGTVSDIDGQYELELEEGEYTLSFSYVGFQEKKVDIIVQGKDIDLDMALSSLEIDEVIVVADVARSRETPVAFSTITPAKLEENIAAQDIPMILNSTPGVYATQEGGGDGDAQVTIRGFSSRNVGVLLDGVPVNDMENGHVYWSNWFGLDAVTRSIQVQRGLGASKLALPSVGGTINIITKGLDNRKEGSLKQEIGSDGYLRTSFGYNTGEIGNGWGVSMAASYKQGNGWVDGTWSKGMFYYLKVDKKAGNHILSASIYGAPQSHGQRSYQLPLQVYDSAYAEELGIRLAYTPGMTSSDSAEVDHNRTIADEGIGRGARYNQHMGYYAGAGEVMELKSERVNQYHKPQITLKDFWTINDNLYMSNIAYMSIGKGGGIRLKGTPAPDPETGLVQFQNIYERNLGYGTIDDYYDSEEHKASNYMRVLKNEHLWYGLLSTLNYRPNNSFSFSGGIDLRNYKGSHYEEVYEFLGADYVAPDFPAYEGVDWTLDNPLADQKLGIGDYNNFYNDGLVRWGGLFFQGEYKTDKFSSFVNLTGSLTSYKRIDYMYGPKPEVLQFETDWNNYSGATAKGGMNYNISEKMNAFVNLGYLSKAPRFNNVYNYANTKYAGVENEFVKAVEAGYSYNSYAFTANINAYYTAWENKPVDKISKIMVEISPGEFEEQSARINGMDALHKGVEFDFIYRINSKLDFQGLVSLGDWKWNSEDTAYIYDDNQVLKAKQYFNAKGVHVGNSAQTQIAGEIRWEPIKGFYIKPRITHFRDYYAEFDPISLDGSPDSYQWYDEETGEHGDPKDSWKIPAYSLVDLHVGYKFRIRENTLQLRGNVLNVLNTTYIATAQNNDPYNGQTYSNFDAKSSSVFMGLGRRFTMSVKYIF